MTATCLRLGCEAAAEVRIHPQYGRPSLWCREHGESALKTYSEFDNRQSHGSRLEELGDQ